MDIIDVLSRVPIWILNGLLELFVIVCICLEFNIRLSIRNLEMEQPDKLNRQAYLNYLNFGCWAFLPFE